MTSPTVPEGTAGRVGRACLPFSLAGSKPLADPHQDSPGLGWPDPSSCTHQTEPPGAGGGGCQPLPASRLSLSPGITTGSAQRRKPASYSWPTQGPQGRSGLSPGKAGDAQPCCHPTPRDQSRAPANPAPPCCRQGKGGPPGPACCGKRTRGSPAAVEGAPRQGTGVLTFPRASWGGMKRKQQG